MKSAPCGREPQKRRAILAPIERDELRGRLDAYVATKRLNRSEARHKILETIFTGDRHFRALDLLVRLKARFPEVGKATLYRNLPILVECGILQEGPTDSSGDTFFELSGSEHHDHIVCLDCKKIFEFHDESIERKQKFLSKNLGFTPRDHRHVIYASCDLLGESR